VDVSVRDTTNPHLRSGTVIAGRDLTLDDRGQAVAVLIMDGTFNDEAVGVGSTIRIDVERTPVELEVVGLIEESFTAGGPADLYIAPGVLDEIEPDFQIFALQVEEEHLNRALVELSSIPLTFTLDVAFIDGLLSRLINQFSAIPTIVGLLSLFAAAVIMANTVALSTLERRRQIGVLKAIGLKGKRVLVIMLLENTVVGLVSALLGIGLSAVGLNILTGLLSTPVPLPRDVVLMTVVLVVVAILIGWTATGLSASVAVRERVMNVLRYD
jgi:predicted lysophospholipase L1 biosynthesis ABC-type transport system permease subunit